MENYPNKNNNNKNPVTFDVLAVMGVSGFTYMLNELCQHV